MELYSLQELLKQYLDWGFDFASILLGSLSFWFVKTEMFVEHMLNANINFGLYPDGILQRA